MNTRKNRGASTAAIVAIIAVVAVVVTVLVVLPFFQASYDSGRFSGTTTYTNEWAKVKVELPSDWKEQAQKIQTKDQMMRMFMSPTLSPFIGIGTLKTHESVDQGLEELRQEVTGGYRGMNVQSKAKTSVKIAGQTYKCLPLVLSNGSATLYMNFYARRVNREGIMMFVACGSNDSEIDQVLSYISKYSK